MEAPVMYECVFSPSVLGVSFLKNKKKEEVSELVFL